MTSRGVIPGPCGLKCSPYIIGELVTIAINDISSIIIANWQHCDFELRPTDDLAYKKMFSGSLNNKIVFAKVKSMSSKHFGIKSWY